MKTPIPYPFRCVISAILMMASSELAAGEESPTVLALWTFEEWTEELDRSQQTGFILPEVGNGRAYGWHEDEETNWRTRVGNGSSRSLDSHRWSKGDYFEFAVSTVGFHSIQLSWDMRRTATGPEEWLFSYSVDGENFTTQDRFFIGTTEWRASSTSTASTYEVSLGGISILDDQPNAFFRIVAAADAASNTGSVRIDNVLVTAIPEPSTITFVAGLAVAALAGARSVGKRFSKEGA